MREGVEKNLRENQGRLRSRRGCADKTFCLRTLIEKCAEFQLPALAIFVDLKAAFDTIHRLRLIRCKYDNCEAAILVEGKITDWYRIETGVRRGCVWSPDLVIHLDGEMVAAVKQFRYLGSEVMSSGRLDEELRTRIERASAAFGQLFKIWRNKISLRPNGAFKMPS